jgi:hypothetical protein
MISPEPVPADEAPFALIVTTDGKTLSATCVTWQDSFACPLATDDVPADEPADELDVWWLMMSATTPPTIPPATAQTAQTITIHATGLRVPLSA